MMLQLFLWWLVLELIGVLALPLALRVLRHLPTRGLGFAKQIGLLLSAYLLWALLSVGILRDTTACAAFALALVGGASGYLLIRHGDELLSALRQRWRFLVAVEVLFLVAMVAFGLFRAYNPDIAATEKPMEFAFINGILRSPTFPPRDPWLSGFSISYYYFGYVMSAMLTRLSGLPSKIGRASCRERV